MDLEKRKAQETKLMLLRSYDRSFLFLVEAINTVQQSPVERAVVVDHPSLCFSQNYRKVFGFVVSGANQSITL